MNIINDYLISDTKFVTVFNHQGKSYAETLVYKKTDDDGMFNYVGENIVHVQTQADVDYYVEGAKIDVKET